MATIAITETNGRTFTLACACLLNNFWTTMPNIIGIRTTCTIEMNKELGDILIHSLANNKISAGVTNGAKWL